MSAIPAAPSPTINHVSLPKLSNSEYALIFLRTLIDVFLITGSLFLLWGFGGMVFREGTLLNTNFTWAWICFFCSLTILGATLRSTSPFARNVICVSCSIFLLANIFIFYVFATTMLWADYEVQLFFIGICTWAIIAIGLLSIEQRLINRCTVELRDTNVTWLQMIPRSLFASMATVFATYFILCIFMCGPKMVEQAYSATWPQTVASIDHVGSQTDDSRCATCQRIDLQYHFEVDGVTYHGTREAAFTSAGNTIHGTLDHRIAEYEADDSLSVAYNPANPNQCMLRPGELNYVILWSWFLLASLAVAISSWSLLAIKHREAFYPASVRVTFSPRPFQWVCLGGSGMAGALLLLGLMWLPPSFDRVGLALVITIWIAYRAWISVPASIEKDILKKQAKGIQLVY